MNNKYKRTISSFFDSYLGAVAAGTVIDAVAVVLQSLGNPPNVFCATPPVLTLETKIY